MSTFEAFRDAIFAQESRNGQVDTSQPNYAGARGKGQILEKTFKGLQRNGKVPANYVWENPEHNEFAAVKYMEEAWQASGGDPRKAGAYYYGGPKAIKGGQIVEYRDLKNPKAPSTLEYADSIASRMGLGKPTSVAQPVRSYSAGEFRANTPDDSVRRSVAADDSALRQSMQPTLLEKFSAAVGGNQDNRIADIFSNWKHEFTPDPAWKPPAEELMGLDSSTVMARLRANSKAEYDHIKAEQTEDNDRAKVVMAGGVGSGLALSFAGEALAVSNWIAPWAAARALGRASLTAAQAGNTGRALGASLVENAAAGTGLELALQTAEGEYDPANLFLAASVDMVIGGVQTVAALRGAAVARAASDVLERESVLLAKVDQSVGSSAPQGVRSAEYQRLRAAELRDPLTDAALPVARERQLMDRPDELETTPASADLQSTPPNQAAGRTGFETLQDVDNSFGRQDRWENPTLNQARVQNASANGGVNEYGVALSKITDGEFPTYQKVAELPAGFHMTKAAKADPTLSKTAAGLQALVKEYLPEDSTVLLGRNVISDKENGVVVSVGRTHVIGLKPGKTTLDDSAFHELGHAVFHQYARLVPEAIMQRINEDYVAFVNAALDGVQRARDSRFSGNNTNLGEGPMRLGAYNVSRDEWFAENFVKHVQNRIVNEEPGIDKTLIQRLAEGLRRLFDMFIKAKRNEVIDPAASVEEFARAVLTRKAAELPRVNAAEVASAVSQADAVSDFLTHPIAAKYGLTLLPVGTTAERADAKAILNLYIKADAWAVKHPLDAAWTARADQMIDNSLLPAASTGLRLLKSENPVARMIASELLEDASGVSGKRQSTAAISKYLHERKFMGNTLNDVQNAYELWSKQRGGSMVTELTDKGAMRSRFNVAVAAEIEARRTSQEAVVTKDQYVKLAADSLQGAYDRIRVSQIENKTLGYQALGPSSVGYMPHKISPNKWLELGQEQRQEQRQVVHTALVDQFVTIEGWDISFADGLASRYLQRVQARATGGHDSPIGGSSAGSAEIIEDAMLSMGMSQDEVRKNMQRFNRGAANWTKGRVDLDLNREYQTTAGTFKLLDVFDTDQVALLRSQAGRASGEVALARHGVYGRPGLNLIRRALAEGQVTRKDPSRLNSELDAFDQVAAEFTNSPFGTAEPKWMENARVLNSVVRLGGIVFNQFAEFVNGVAHVGASRTLSAIGSIGRLRSEIKALASGKTVDNPLLTSIERLGGAEFGTDAYKIVMPFDAPDHAYPTYGRDTLSHADRLLRGASYAQAKLSLWRTMHSVQQRGFAEQIVAKIARYSVDGKEDTALRQFGISEQLQAALKADGVARWDNGSLVEFDVTKLADPTLREELIQAVHRGVSQIIQGTFIGETGKWAHEGYLKMLTQFRTFSLTAMEKQWARQKNSRGVAQALGIMLGSMAAVVPVYTARVYAQSIGREDREEFIEARLAPEVIARQTLNYIALSGLAGDFLDAAAVLAPDSLDLKKITGNRSGSDTEFIGNVVAPALSLVDDGWKALQNLDDPERLAKLLPGSRLPYVLPAINALGD